MSALLHGHYTNVNGDEIHASDAVRHAEHTDCRGVYNGPFGTIKTTIRGERHQRRAVVAPLDLRMRLRIPMRKARSLNGIIVRRRAEDGTSIASG